jgi:hypothetical protein
MLLSPIASITPATYNGAPTFIQFIVNFQIYGRDGSFTRIDKMKNQKIQTAKRRPESSLSRNGMVPNSIKSNGYVDGSCDQTPYFLFLSALS